MENKDEKGIEKTESTQTDKSGENDQNHQMAEGSKDHQSPKSYFDNIVIELKDKPVTVLIAILTFLGGVLFSVIKFCSYMQDMHYAEIFHISKQLFEQDLSVTTLATLVLFIMTICAFGYTIFSWLYARRKTPVFSLYKFLCVAYIVLCFFIFRELFPAIKKGVLIVYIIAYVLLLAVHLYDFIKDIKDYLSKLRNNNSQNKDKVKKTDHTSRSTESIFLWSGVALFLFFVIITLFVMIKDNKDTIVHRIEGSVIIYEEKMYAVIYKSDDYVIGEAIEEKVNYNGETCYEIDTNQQKLFDSFDFEMKYLGDDARFELKTSSATNQNPTPTNTTIPDTSALITTAPDTTAANPTDHNP